MQPLSQLSPEGLQKAGLCVHADQEAMRVRPVASSGTTRIAKRKLQLGPYNIPAGSMLLVPFDAVHHFKGNWEQPDDFIPVRLCPFLALPYHERCTSGQVFCKPQPCSRISSRTMNLQHGVDRSHPLAKPFA